MPTNPDPFLTEAIAFTDATIDFLVNAGEAVSPTWAKSFEEMIRPFLKAQGEVLAGKLVAFLEGHVGFLKAVIARTEAGS